MEQVVVRLNRVGITLRIPDCLRERFKKRNPEERVERIMTKFMQRWGKRNRAIVGGFGFKILPDPLNSNLDVHVAWNVVPEQDGLPREQIIRWLDHPSGLTLGFWTMEQKVKVQH